MWLPKPHGTVWIKSVIQLVAIWLGDALAFQAEVLGDSVLDWAFGPASSTPNY